MKARHRHQARQHAARSDGRPRGAGAASAEAAAPTPLWLVRADEEISRLETVVESCDLAIVGQTLDGAIASWNPIAELIYGYGSAEAVGQPIAMLVPPDRSEELAIDLEKLRRGERVDWHETEHVRKNGERIPLSVSVSPMRDTSGQVIGAVTLARGVAMREPNVEALSAAHQALRLYARIVEDSPDGISLIDRNYVYRMVNPAYCRWNGLPADRILGRTSADLVGEDAFNRLIRPNLDRCFAGETVSYEAWFTYASGERRYAELHYYPLLEKGRVEYAVVLARDSTERKRAEEERELLRRQQVSAYRRNEELMEAAQHRAAELQTALDTMVDAVYVFDTAGRMTLANEAGLRLVGLSSMAEVRHPLAEVPQMLRVRHRDGTPILPDELVHIRALAGEVIVAEEQLAYNPQTQQDIYLLLSAAPIVDERGHIVGSVAVARDVTELLALDRLKDQFIAVAAHELKTPVAIMKGYAQTLLRTPGGLPPMASRMLDAINRGADRIDQVVRDLLDISRLYAGRLELQLEPIDLAELVAGIVDRMALTIDAAHLIRIERAEPLIVRGDRDRLEQVMVNLLDNAIRYSPGGGEVAVAIARRDANAVVSVSDEGIGIPREKQAHIFERFFRAHTGTPFDYGGMGVGLYISREIVTRHGGRMWFESEEGKGSTFYFSLPLA